MLPVLCNPLILNGFLFKIIFYYFSSTFLFFKKNVFPPVSQLLELRLYHYVALLLPSSSAGNCVVLAILANGSASGPLSVSRGFAPAPFALSFGQRFEQYAIYGFLGKDFARFHFTRLRQVYCLRTFLQMFIFQKFARVCSLPPVGVCAVGRLRRDCY